jgi:DNA-binding beta-propeller fold protein YncE
LNKTIDVFSKDFQETEIWSCIPGDTPVGVCVSPDGSLVIVTCLTKHKHFRICVYNIKGVILNNRSFPRSDEAMLHPSVVVCSGETIAVLDEKRNRLATYDMDIHPLATFSSPSITLEGLCAGREGEFYVSSSNTPDFMRFDAKLRLLGYLNFKCLKTIKKPHRLTSSLNTEGDILLSVTTPINQQEIGIMLTDMTLKQQK